MTKPIKRDDNVPNTNFYFWLGDNGETEAVTEDEFDERVAKVSERDRKWRDVDVLTGEGWGGD